MDFRRLSLVAACWALRAVALANGDGGAPALETSVVELAEKSHNGISPVPTSRPELAEIELFKRAYTMPSDYCGWYSDYKSASYTCGMISASCINVGNYRGCCNGQIQSCASTFYSTCIPGKSLSLSQSCGKSTICCSGTDYPECGTMLFSSRTNTDKTYTNIDCYSTGFGSTYAMQDYPAGITTTTSDTSTTSTSETATTTSTSSSSTTTTPPPTPTPDRNEDPKSTPIGPIVGGAVGGVAVLGLIGLGTFLIRRHNRNRPSDTTAATTTQPQPPTNYPPPQMNQVQSTSPYSPTGPGVPPAYDPRYSYANAPQQARAYQMSPDPNTGAFGYPSPVGSPPFPSPTSPDPVKMAGGQGSDGMGFHAHEVIEAPATNPVGIGNNRAELGV